MRFLEGRLLHLKISKKFKKDQIEANSYIIEVEGCCYISIYFLIYLLRVEIFFMEFSKWAIFRHRKTCITTRTKKSYWYIDFDKMALIGKKKKD